MTAEYEYKYEYIVQSWVRVWVHFHEYEYEYEYILCDIIVTPYSHNNIFKNKHCELIYIIQEELTMQWQLITLFYEEN